MKIKKEYICDECNTEFDFIELGYLGVNDTNEEQCNPFMKLLCLCKNCYIKFKTQKQ